MSNGELIAKARTDLDYLRGLLDSGAPIARGMLAYALNRLAQVTDALEATAPSYPPMSEAQQHREASTHG